MTVATLSEVLQPALTGRYAVAGLVCLGWEETRAYVAAAEAEDAPVILQAGPACRAHTPLPVLAAMFRYLAEQASVPVVPHLDHATTAAECREALDCGFTSVMYDGSRLEISRNIDQTAEIAELAHAAGASCEGEIGFVGYAEGAASALTDPEQAARFAEKTGIDAMAVSVGNVHLQTAPSDGLNEGAIRAIEARTAVPLVIHGGSGVPAAQRAYFARSSTICKFNIGTELRQAFGAGLRAAMAADPAEYDRIKLLSATHEPVAALARRIIRDLSPAGASAPTLERAQSA